MKLTNFNGVFVPVAFYPKTLLNTNDLATPEFSGFNQLTLINLLMPRQAGVGSSSSKVPTIIWGLTSFSLSFLRVSTITYPITEFTAFTKILS